ncbi:MAG: DUF2242 domain-containing protein [Pseudoxanthomonas sp.]
MRATETFDSDNTYTQVFENGPDQVCEAGRRALMSQGYVIQRADGLVVEGTKSFQPEADIHEQVQLRVSCVSQADGHSWAFASALQDRYGLKKSSTAASVGTPMGSVSLPFGSTDDSLVKVASRTVQDGAFYKHFFALIQRYLPPPPKPEDKKSVPVARAEAPRPAPSAPEPEPEVQDEAPLQPEPMKDAPTVEEIEQAQKTTPASPSEGQHDAPASAQESTTP